MWEETVYEGDLQLTLKTCAETHKIILEFLWYFIRLPNVNKILLFHKNRWCGFKKKAIKKFLMFLI